MFFCWDFWIAEEKNWQKFNTIRILLAELKQYDCAMCMLIWKQVDGLDQIWIKCMNSVDIVDSTLKYENLKYIQNMKCFWYKKYFTSFIFTLFSDCSSSFLFWIRYIFLNFFFVSKCMSNLLHMFYSLSNPRRVEK